MNNLTKNCCFNFSGAGNLAGNILLLAGEGTLTLSGKGELSISGHGRLTLALSPNTSFTITSLIAADQTLELILTGLAGDYVQLSHHISLHHGASYTERIALQVSGQLDLFTQVTHLTTSSSKLITKLAIKDGAKAIARGTIIINANAAGSVASARLDALLLGDKAVASLLPVLQVANDDVSCKHGATVGHLDQNILFYLQSRGLNDASSRQLLADAFLNP